MDIATYETEAAVEASHWWFVVRRILSVALSVHLKNDNQLYAPALSRILKVIFDISCRLASRLKSPFDIPMLTPAVRGGPGS